MEDGDGVARAVAAGAGGGRGGGPRVSVIMANWQGERYLVEAVASVLAQSASDLELLVADDASDDRSLEIVQAAAAADSRVRLLPAAANGGPSAARNRALAAARGQWVAVVDSDDLLHPRRIEILLDAADRLGADMVADDMAFFGTGPGAAGRTLLGPLALCAPWTVTPAFFVRSNNANAGLPSLGYLKPLIRRAAMGDLRYDPAVRVGEDYDLYLRILLRGARFEIVPLPLYLYRRHGTSLSHRLSVAALEPLVAAHEAVVATLGRDGPATDSDLAKALAQRGRSLGQALRFERLVAALKARRVAPAAGLLLRDPALLRALARSLRERLARRRAQGPADPASPARLLLVPEGSAPPTGLDEAAGRDGVLEVPPLAPDRVEAAPRLRDLVCRLTEVASRRPVDVAVAGLGALDGLGLLPGWRHAEVWLTAAEEAALGTLPAGVHLRRAAP
jgi:succinoglycan biosynthesis protein ExoO